MKLFCTFTAFSHSVISADNEHRKHRRNFFITNTMANIYPYLNFDGKCEEAFEFYKKAFAGEFSRISRASDSPMKLPENEKNRLLYIELPIGNGKLMGSDIFPSFGHQLVLGNQNHISISADSKEEADRLFVALSEGGEVEMPLGEAFFGYFGSFKDRFGVGWLIVFQG